MYEEAREAGEESKGFLGTGRSGIGFGEDGEEWDESVNGFGCDFYEECCGEGCVYGEIGQEECFWLCHLKYNKILCFYFNFIIFWNN